MRLDVSAHPFTIGIEPEDVRITTWYHGKDFRRSLLAVIHEYGHALYELQVSPLLYETPIRGQNSLGIHESQSRFWENVLGRSREFVEKITPFVKDILGYEKVDAEEIFKYFNIVRPDLIRVEADEVTYNFHILIRYEIEVGLIEGSIEVKELPQIWNEKYEKYLGVTPKNDAEGVLQDIHWSFGAFGYFPTYTYGNLLAAQLKYTVPELKEALAEGNPIKVKEILREKIHQFGSMYEPTKLVKMVTGEELNPKYFLQYIKEKYQ
jgi:carboxypeptidase Taq